MKETESIQTVDTNIKIPFWKAACFGLGDFGNNFVWTFVGSYLMIFYTDVFGIPMAAVSLLMLIARAWDAIDYRRSVRPHQDPLGPLPALGAADVFPNSNHYGADVLGTPRLV